MSIVSALIIKDKKIRFVRKHYRDIMRLLESKKPRTKKFVDAGYIIVDLDKKVLLNCQEAFALSDIGKDEWKNMLSEWRVLDYANW